MLKTSLSSYVLLRFTVFIIVTLSFIIFKEFYLCVLFQVSIKLKKAGTRLEHHGIKVEFVGQIGRSKICVSFFVLLMSLVQGN